MEQNISAFDHAVYAICKDIPKGKVSTYKMLAIKLGSASKVIEIYDYYLNHFDSKIQFKHLLRREQSAMLYVGTPLHQKFLVIELLHLT
jgi:hypothetical protein